MGFPSAKKSLPQSMGRYWCMKDCSSIKFWWWLYYDNVWISPGVTKKPSQESIRKFTCNLWMKLTKARALMIAYWPGIGRDIERVVEACQRCGEELPSQSKEPLLSHDIPSRVFEQTYLFSYGRCNFLFVTDFKSGWPTTYNLSTIQLTTVPDLMKEWGVRHISLNQMVMQSLH